MSVKIRSVDDMLAVPGIYLVSTRSAATFVEVADGGECHQLELVSGDYRRDGLLTRDRWNLVAIRSIDGPFARQLTEVHLKITDSTWSEPKPPKRIPDGPPVKQECGYCKGSGWIMAQPMKRRPK